MMNVGIIGCGSIARVHAMALNGMFEVCLVACADITPEQANKFAHEFGCRPYTSLDDMLENERLNAAHICTPHHLHVPMAIELAQRGISVFMEKPPAINREQWEALQKVASMVPMGFCFQNRYNPNVLEARHLIAAGKYGELLGARAFVTWKREREYYSQSGWRGQWETEGGGALINQAIHTLDLLVWIMGKPDQVDAHLANRHLAGVIEVEDTVEARFVLGGKPVLFYASNGFTKDAPVLIEFHMEKAVLRLEDERLEVHEPGKIVRRGFPMSRSLGKSYWGNGHKACIEDYYRSITGSQVYRNGLHSISNTMETVLRIYEQNRCP